MNENGFRRMLEAAKSDSWQSLNPSFVLLTCQEAEHFVSYTVKCILKNRDYPVVEAMATANSAENEDWRKVPLLNTQTILETAMARALTVATTLLDYFPFDTPEQLGKESSDSNQPQNNNHHSELISEAQRRRLFALAKGNRDLINQVIQKFGYRNSWEITKDDYNRISEEIERLAIRNYGRIRGG